MTAIVLLQVSVLVCKLGHDYGIVASTVQVTVAYCSVSLDPPSDDVCDVMDNMICGFEVNATLCEDLGCCWNSGTCVHSNGWSNQCLHKVFFRQTYMHASRIMMVYFSSEMRIS